MTQQQDYVAPMKAASTKWLRGKGGKTATFTDLVEKYVPMKYWSGRSNDQTFHCKGSTVAFPPPQHKKKTNKQNRTLCKSTTKTWLFGMGG